MAKKLKKTKPAALKPAVKAKAPAAKPAVKAAAKKPVKAAPAPAVTKKAKAPIAPSQPAKKPAKAAAVPAVPAKVAAKGKVVAKKAEEKSPAPKKVVTAVKPVPEKAAAKAKGKTEVVVEVPASKIGSIITKGLAKDSGKKKAKGSSELAAANAKKRCREPACDQDGPLAGYCRMHYIKNWRKIKRKEAIIASGQLNNYVEELVSKYPDKYLEVIRQDLASEKDWSKVVVDLELDAGEEEIGGEDDIDVATEGVQRSGGRGTEFDEGDDSF